MLRGGSGKVKAVEELRRYREEKLKEYAIMVQYKQLKEVSVHICIFA